MNLIITTNHAHQAGGYSPLCNAAALAFKHQFPNMEDVKFFNNRITALRDGYPVRFQVSTFSPKDHLDLIFGMKESVICTLKALPVLVTEMV